MKSLHFLLRLVPAFILLSLFTLTLEIVVRLGWVPAFLIPAPSEVWAALQQDPGLFRTAFTESLRSALLGFFLSIFCGSFIALGLCLHPWLERAFLPISVFFQTVPIIAIAPLLVIWFGFGAPTVIASAAIVSFFPVLANALAGLTRVPVGQLELFRFLQATRTQTLWKLRIPNALPSFFTGLEVASGLAVIGAIVGEFIAGGGLGSLIDSARTQQRVDLVFAAVLLSTLLGLSFVVMIHLLRAMVFRMRPFSEKNEAL